MLRGGAGESAEGARHARPEIARALRANDETPSERPWKHEPRAIRRDAEHGGKTAIGEETAEQAAERRAVEAERGLGATAGGEPVLHGAKARHAGEDEDGILHE